jgi:hypothetical protein
VDHFSKRVFVGGGVGEFRGYHFGSLRVFFGTDKPKRFFAVGKL